MRNYREILKASVIVGTYAAQLKAITKVKAVTEDNDLAKLIEETAVRLKDKCALYGPKVVPSALEEDNDLRVRNLIDYCKKAISANLPEWQVLALKNGWKGPHQS